MGGEDQHTGLRPRLLDPRQRLHPTHMRHRQVQQDDIRLEYERLVDRFATVVGHTHNIKALQLKVVPDALGEQHFVVGDKYSDGGFRHVGVASLIVSVRTLPALSIIQMERRPFPFRFLTLLGVRKLLPRWVARLKSPCKVSEHRQSLEWNQALPDPKRGWKREPNRHSAGPPARRKELGSQKVPFSRAG